MGPDEGHLKTVADTTPAPDDTTPPRDPAASAAPQHRALIAPGLRLLAVYAIVRIALLVADVFAAHVSYSSNLAGPLHSWDSNWYLVVAMHGYPAIAPTAGGQLTYSAAGFLPVFPGLIRLATFAGFTAVGGALVVSVISGAAATLVVWRLGAALVDDATGWNAAVLFILFPGMGIAWGLFYCECVGLALAGASLLLMLRKRWVWAGIFGAFATATSPMALPLALAAAVPALHAIRRRELKSAFWTVGLTPTGFMGYVIALAVRYHDAGFWWHLQSQAWGASVDYGRSLVELLPHLSKVGYQGPAWLEWIGLAVALAAVHALWRAKLPSFINVYCGGVLLLLFVSNSLGFKPRLLTWAFPALIAVAKIVSPRTWVAVAVAFACMLPVVFLVYTMLGNSMAQP